MGATTLLPGDKGADYVRLTPEIKRWLLAEQCRFVLRYVVPPETTRIGKVITDDEIRWLSDHRIAIVPNWEVSHDEANGGAPRGRRAGMYLRQWAAAKRIPESVPLIVSVDTDTHPGNIKAHTAFVEAFRDHVRPHPFGVYGDVDIAAATRPALFWRANAGGWGRARADVGATIQQHRALYPPGVDPNTALAPFVAWAPWQPATPEEALPVYFTLKAQPAAVWQIIAPYVAIRVGPTQFAMRKIDARSIGVLSAEEAELYTFIPGGVERGVVQ